ncbi:amidase [Mesorhizobium sp. M7A.F.Ca.US.011.01.1.1]|uniref:amidase n=1 Tax=Mesorhizobium sp. M7A.F.Ca.US.011.01.1.1 TaxID=2496741 RepID=UPI000FCAEAD6|nr:amidase family protein [Mesorhizobium sp. M7A.F.Ca.US.011.01.1.1]RUX27624.1 amidase [Mesorhizobium sp. M7A.F.Ca.US.011.01.1.1]
MKLTEYAAYDGVGLADLLRKREVTPRELGNCILSGIAAVNPQLNAVIETYADAIEALGEVPGPAPFHGMPTLTKDFPIEAGRPGEFGSVLAKGFICGDDHAFWVKMRSGGLANIGRTTTSEFGIAAATESSLYGATRNPWDTSRGVSGSSGGAAAAVAAGIVPFAQGADGGGSIRTPAAFCGVVGLKPSRGRISGAPESNAPMLGLAISFMLTRSIRDTAALLDLGSGALPGDSYEIVPPTTSYAQAIKTPPKALRIALCTTSWSGYPLDAEVRTAVLEVGKRLEQLGHKVVEAGPVFDYERYLAAQKVIWAASTAQSLDELAGLLRRSVEEACLQQTTLAVYRHGRTLDAASLIAALAVYDQITRTVGEFLAVHDVLVTPTCAISPELLGTHNPDRPGRDIDTVFADLAPKETFSALFNGTGSPAISLPLGWTQNGLPIGVQFVAAFGRDDLLLRLGAVLEADYAWHQRKPPTHITKTA